MPRKSSRDAACRDRCGPGEGANQRAGRGRRASHLSREDRDKLLEHPSQGLDYELKKSGGREERSSCSHLEEGQR